MTFEVLQFSFPTDAMRALTIPIVHRAVSNFLYFVDADAAASSQYMVTSHTT
jgi:hypothetical protein